MKVTVAWGALAVAVMMWSGSALGQAPAGLPAAAGAGGGAGAPTSPAAGGEAAVPAPEATAPPVSPVPVAAPAPAPAPSAEEGYEEEERPRRKRRRRRAELDEAPADEDEAERELARSDWRLVDRHFIISAERMASVLGNSSTVQQVSESFDPFTGAPTMVTREVNSSGTDVSFLGGGLGLSNPFAVPRLAFDGMFSNGFTLGGALSYFVSSGETERADLDGSGVITTTERPTVSVFLLAPRLGVMLAPSPKLGIWLRGGVTRLSVSEDDIDTDFDTGQQITSTTTMTLVNVTLDPQLVISPVPHVALLLGAAIDIGATGTIERSRGGLKEEEDMTASSYGVTAGIAAIF